MAERVSWECMLSCEVFADAAQKAATVKIAVQAFAPVSVTDRDSLWEPPGCA